MTEVECRVPGCMWVELTADQLEALRLWWEHWMSEHGED